MHGAAKSRIQLKQLSTLPNKLLPSLATVSKCVSKYVLFHTAFLRLMVQEWLTWMVLAQNLHKAAAKLLARRSHLKAEKPLAIQKHPTLDRR